MDKKTWFVHAEFVVLFVTLIGGFYALTVHQGARTDKLYEMFVEMRKDFYQETKEFHTRVNIIETKMEERSKN